MRSIYAIDFELPSAKLSVRRGSLISQCGGPDFFLQAVHLGSVMEWQWDRFFSEQFCFSLLVTVLPNAAFSLSLSINIHESSPTKNIIIIANDYHVSD